MPRGEKVRLEEKAELVLKCIRGEIGVCEAGRMAQVDHSTIRSWIARYQAEGLEGLKRQERNRNYTTEEKLRAVLTYINGKGSLCRSFLEAACLKTAMMIKLNHKCS